MNKNFRNKPRITNSKELSNQFKMNHMINENNSNVEKNKSILSKVNNDDSIQEKIIRDKKNW